ncbi:MAG TPA: hypothetical protein VIQ30_25910 [Pseudonocardia sp.]
MQKVESKVKAGAAGAPLGVAVGGFACWLIDAYVHTPGKEGDLPVAVTLLVMAATASAVAYGSAWLAKHTPRGLAVGGPIPPGRTVVVGEHGPEQFDLPRSSS